MFDKEKTYKFEIKSQDNTIFYTGKVIEETEFLIKIKTKFNEEKIIGKSKELVQAHIVKENKEGGKQ